MRPTRIATALTLTGLCAALLSVVAGPAEALTLGAASGIWTAPAPAPVTAADAAGDGADAEGGEETHGEMDMSDTEMTELGHDAEGGDYGEDAGPGAHQEETTTHDDGAEAPPARPRAAVLTSFFVVNSGVLVAAALLRRHDRSKPSHRPRPVAGAPAAPQPA